MLVSVNKSSHTYLLNAAVHLHRNRFKASKINLHYNMYIKLFFYMFYIFCFLFSSLTSSLFTLPPSFLHFINFVPSNHSFFNSILYPYYIFCSHKPFIPFQFVTFFIFSNNHFILFHVTVSFDLIWVHAFILSMRFFLLLSNCVYFFLLTSPLQIAALSHFRPRPLHASDAECEEKPDCDLRQRVVEL